MKSGIEMDLEIKNFMNSSVSLNGLNGLSRLKQTINFNEYYSLVFEEIRLI